MERMEKSISTDEWNAKYKEPFITKNLEEETNLDLFHFTVRKLDVFRMKMLIGKSRNEKFLKEINTEFEECVKFLSKELNIKKSKQD